METQPILILAYLVTGLAQLARDLMLMIVIRVKLQMLSQMLVLELAGVKMSFIMQQLFQHLIASLVIVIARLVPMQ